MIKILEERNFPISELIPLASARSAGSVIPFRGKDVVVQEVTPNSFAGIDIVLGAAPNKLAKEYAPHIVAAGAVFVDNSSAFRMDENVPLVIPEINPEDALKHNGIISNPNCSTIVSLVAVNALNKISPIKNMVVSTYQAVSGAGAGGPVELTEEVSAINEGRPVEPSVFPYQIAFNLIPQIGNFTENGYTAEEMKMQNEGRKILHLPELLVGCTCVRVPVYRSHSISITLRTESPISVADAQKAISEAAGCRLVDNPEAKEYPMPIDTSDQDIVFVGRIRKDLTSENGLSLWCCGDQVRKGAATNTIQIAELLIK
jgi:aspartate-semialdehyde dehydrogenase